MNTKELKSILAKHKKWLNDTSGGVRADLSGADLSGANLSDADLRGANLAGADLSCAKLVEVNLAGADLSCANLARANMFGAMLGQANLVNARLEQANLDYANLAGANLANARLEHVSLSMADMECADIYTAFFDKKEEFRKGIVLKKAIKGYKNTSEGVVITAEIPAGAIVFSINGRKCRTSTATIVNMAGHKLLHSQYDYKFTYTLGQKIIIPDFDTRYNVECSTGFHFFRKKIDAIGY